jgi:hypothetical protein
VPGELQEQVIDQTYWLVHFGAGSLSADPLGSSGRGHEVAGTAASADDARLEAARLAFVLIRFAGAAAYPRIGHTPAGVLRVGTEAYIFGPSWHSVPRNEVEAFLLGLPSPALLVPTLTRGVIALTLVHELDGDRRRWAEKTLSNLTAGLDEMGTQLGLSAASRILVEFDDESHVFSFAAVRHYAQQFAVDVGCNLTRLEGDVRADACLMLLRSDGREFPGRSCMLRRRSAGGAA